MARTLYGILAASARASHRQRVATQRAQLRERQRQARESSKTEVRKQAWDEKERKKQYLASREEEAAERTREVESRVTELTNMLVATLGETPVLNFNLLKEILEPQLFDPGHLGQTEPTPVESSYVPARRSLIQGFIPALRRKHEEEIEEGRRQFASALAEHAAREEKRLEALSRARTVHHEIERKRKEQVAGQHEAVDTFEREVREGGAQAVSEYFKTLLETQNYPEGFPQLFKAAFTPESSQAVIECDLPSIVVVPEEVGFRYVKSKDEIVPIARPQSGRRSVYASVIAQIALRTIREVFESEIGNRVSSVVFNGCVDATDPGTGKPIRPCLISVRATKDRYAELNLSGVDPLSCLKTLNAAVSKSPGELTAVRPILEFKMVDPRFIAGQDVLSDLDTRPNLMELSPNEFEALISNLFEKMGLETRQTRPSRDGGVDCVAYDPRPIFGGKVVIQAKRYRHTVGVSAVRDLFGTVQNEGASKGILVTTSGYGKASFEFASGKPIELLSGSNLLFLLAEHAGLEAKIVVPEDWKDPLPDMPTAIE